MERVDNFHKEWDMRRRAIKYLLLTMGVLVLTTGMGNNMNSSETPVDPSDGIDKNEAISIARPRVKQHADRINFSRPRVEDSDLVDDAWVVRFPFKLNFRIKSGLRTTNVHIDKQTGEIKSEGDSPS